jgi:hypothetical protein
MGSASAVDTVRALRDTRLVTRAAVVCAVIAACLLTLASGASARSKPRVEALAFAVTDATMSEDLTFQGDGGPACARAGVCQTAGNIHYGFGGLEFGDFVLLLIRVGHRSTALGFGSLGANGLTTATVTNGSGPSCTDKLIHTADGFDVAGKPGRVRFTFHSSFDPTDFLGSYCAGPSGADLNHVHALPRFSVPTSRLRHNKVSLSMSSSRQFHAGPFTGTLNFSVTLKLRRQRVPSFLTTFFGAT